MLIKFTDKKCRYRTDTLLLKIIDKVLIKISQYFVCFIHVLHYLWVEFFRNTCKVMGEIVWQWRTVFPYILLCSPLPAFCRVMEYKYIVMENSLRTSDL